MRLLLTGANGQLGHALLRTAPEGATIMPTAADDLDIGNADAVHETIERLRPDIILNTAAYTAVDKAESDEASAWRVNRDGVANLADAAREGHARLVHISTDFVFDGQSGRPYPPDAPTAPLNVYGRTKRAGEQCAGPDALIVRTSWLYGRTGHNFVRTMLRLMAERDEVRVVADQVGTPTCADSLAQALWTLLDTGAQGLLHYADSGVASWYDFAVAIQEEALGIGLLSRGVPVVPIASRDYPVPARRPSYSVLDRSATVALTGAHPPHWRVNLRAMLKAVKAHG